ncbi:hypothetical protein ASPCAL11565 [Aspergillus calidoustus]|uniref:Uncharacterized protein n=1 Tax=Aspergillus calidoustus TaxID=454130 RepID=A0A0U5GF23_ASPCI|nr:hypothetical protein ASPCAL11565 [Aspergillus calidoustus]
MPRPNRSFVFAQCISGGIGEKWNGQGDYGTVVVRDDSAQRSRWKMHCVSILVSYSAIGMRYDDANADSAVLHDLPSNPSIEPLPGWA